MAGSTYGLWPIGLVMVHRASKAQMGLHLELDHVMHVVKPVLAQCTVRGGREGRDIDAVELARAVEALGAGEILLNCIDTDGQCAACL